MLDMHVITMPESTRKQMLTKQQPKADGKERERYQHPNRPVDAPRCWSRGRFTQICQGAPEASHANRDDGESSREIMATQHIPEGGH
jgi:hypothetical protein